MTSCDIETLGTPPTTTAPDGPMRETPTEDMGSRATPLERENGTGESSAYKGNKKVGLSPTEDEPLASPRTTIPKRLQKKANRARCKNSEGKNA